MYLLNTGSKRHTYRLLFVGFTLLCHLKVLKSARVHAPILFQVGFVEIFHFWKLIDVLFEPSFVIGEDSPKNIPPT